jgi:HEAT repeat protein
VSVSCHGQGLETVLRCLLGTDADLAFSYEEAAPGKTGHGALAGVKILSSTFEKLPAHALTNPGQSGLGQPLSSEEMLARTRSEDPDQRARALDQIGRFDQIDKVTLQTAYIDALKDNDGDVRAAAVNGLALLDEKASFPMLSSAMSDESASVRLAALDAMDVDEQSLAFIAEALSDPDESVRTLAQMRLGIE